MFEKYLEFGKLKIWNKCA